MNKFNLTFSGEILDGHDADEVRVSFAKLFAIDDPRRLERFFTGETIILRRNLNRKAAAEYFLKTHNLGAATQLVKADTGQASSAPATGQPGHQPASDPTAPDSGRRASLVTAPATELAKPSGTSKSGVSGQTATRAPRPARPARLKKASEVASAAEQTLKEQARRVLAQRERQRKVRADHAARAAAAQRELDQRRAEEAAQFQAAQERTQLRAAQRLKQSLTPRLASARGPGPAAGGTRSRRSGRRARASGPPNVFSLRPFRSTTQIRERAAHAQRLANTSFSVALGAALVLLSLMAYRWWQSPPAIIQGPETAAVNHRTDLLLATGDHLLLHDRSGVGSRSIELRSLGLSRLAPPLLFLADGYLLGRGVLAAAGESQGETAVSQLLRCNLEAEANQCQPFGNPVSAASALAMAHHPRTGDLYLADPEAGELLLLDDAAELRTRASLPMPAAPVLRIHDGLLLMNSATGPGISVLRQEPHALGAQLDEILLLPEPAMAAGQSRVGDFVWSGQSWWVVLYHPHTLDSGLYRFDANWKFIEKLPLARGTRPQQLLSWGSKTLVLDTTRPELQRFGPQGQLEVPLVSDLLSALINSQQKTALRSELGWKVGLSALASLLALAMIIGHYNQFRRQVYQTASSRGAEPVDKLATLVRWIQPASKRNARFQLAWALFAVLATALIAVAINLQVTVNQLGALLTALGGPALAIYLLWRSHPGHIGVIGEKLLLVDHTDTYHLGAGPRVQYRSPFVMVDDVVVFTGNRLLPGFDETQLLKDVAPIASNGVKVDRTTVLVKLLQNQHPLATGLVAVLVASGLAGLVLLF